MSDEFNFTGSTDTYRYPYHEDAPNAVDSFFITESLGRNKLSETSDPDRLEKLLRAKAGVNMQIKMYAEGRADGTLPLIDFIDICVQIRAPRWFIEAVENQKFDYYVRRV